MTGSAFATSSWRSARTRQSTASSSSTTRPTDAEDEDSGRAASWVAVREGIQLGAEASEVPVMVSSTLPELLDEAAAIKFMDAGVPAVAGLRTGLACAAALDPAAGGTRPPS